MPLDVIDTCHIVIKEGTVDVVKYCMLLSAVACESLT